MTDSDSGLRGCRQLPPFRSVRRGLGLDGLRLRKPRWSRKWADADVGFLKVPDNFYIFEKNNWLLSIFNKYIPVAILLARDCKTRIGIFFSYKLE